VNETENTENTEQQLSNHYLVEQMDALLGEHTAQLQEALEERIQALESTLRGLQQAVSAQQQPAPQAAPQVAPQTAVPPTPAAPAPAAPAQPMQRQPLPINVRIFAPGITNQHPYRGWWCYLTNGPAGERIYHPVATWDQVADHYKWQAGERNPDGSYVNRTMPRDHTQRWEEINKDAIAAVQAQQQAASSLPTANEVAPAPSMPSFDSASAAAPAAAEDEVDSFVPPFAL